MKKIIIYVVIIIVLGSLSGVVTYVLLNDNDKTKIKENNNESAIKEDSVKLLSLYNLNDKIIEEFEITLNNKTEVMKIEYTSEFIKKDLDYEDSYYMISGKFLENKFYLNKTYDYNFSIDKIKNDFNEKNFIIIKGTDNKSYLLVTTDFNLSLNNSILLVFNDNLELISKNLIPENESPVVQAIDGFVINEYSGNTPCRYSGNNPEYTATFKNYSTYNPTRDSLQFVKILDNKIYFLYPKLNFKGSFLVNEEDYGFMEERVYTINTNKLEYNVINTYKITEVCQKF